MQQLNNQAEGWFGTQGPSRGLRLKKKTKFPTRANHPWLDKDGHFNLPEFVLGGTDIDVGTDGTASQKVLFPSPNAKEGFPLPFDVSNYHTLVSNDDASDADSTAVRNSIPHDRRMEGRALGHAP